MTVPLEDYGLIGNGETAALVSRSGSIDWLCWPRFDSDACFAAILGTEDNGHWRIAPCDPARTARRYQSDTLVLETDFETESGAARVIDFMAGNHGLPLLFRLVSGLRGRCRMQSKLNLKFDYGGVAPWVEAGGKTVTARAGPDLAVLYSPVEITQDGNAIIAGFEVRQGDELPFLLGYGASATGAPDLIDAKSSRRVPRGSLLSHHRTYSSYRAVSNSV